MTVQRPLPTAAPRSGWRDRLDAACAVVLAGAESADAEAHVVQGAWDALHQFGLATAPFPAAFGGEDLGAPERHAALLDALRRIGAADLSIARLFEGHVNAVQLVCRYGTRSQIADMADRVRTGGLSGVWGAEDAAGLAAERQPEGWALRGRKILASGAGLLTCPLLPVRTEAGQLLMLVPLETGERADVSGWTAQGMRSSATGAVELTGVRVGDDQVVGGPGDFMRQPAFSGGAWRFCAVHLGAAERLLDLFREHLVSRGRGEDPYQLERVAHAAAAVGTAAFWVRDAARRFAEDARDPEAVVAFANMTRMVTERACLDVLEVVHRGVGLGAFVRPHPIERVTRDLSTYLRQPVPDLAMADTGRAVLASDRPTAALWD